MSRLTIPQWAMELVDVTAKRSTCIRRQVGCVLLNERNHVLSTGYNGAAAGLPHCNESGFCAKSGFASGEGLDYCVAIHAEQNALLQCRNVYEIHSVFVTASPCITCTKLLLNTSARTIIYRDEYPHPEAKCMWLASGKSTDLHQPRWGQFIKGEVVWMS